MIKFFYTASVFICLLGLAFFLSYSGLIDFEADKSRTESLIYGLYLLVLGGHLVMGTQKYAKRLSSADPIERKRPDQPWLFRNDWKKGFAHSDIVDLTRMNFFLGLMSGFLGSLGALKFFTPEGIEYLSKEFETNVFGVIFVVVSISASLIFFVVQMAYQVQSYIHFFRNKTHKISFQNPLKTGGLLEARCDFLKKIDFKESVPVLFRCKKMTPGRSATNEMVDIEEILHKEEKHFDLHNTKSGSFLNLKFDIPEGLPTTKLYNYGSISWEIIVDLPGRFNTLNFEIPVIESNIDLSKVKQ